jgi:hypothetical protein
VPLEGESTLHQQKPSQSYFDDADMKDADQNTSQYAYKKSKIVHNKDDEDVEDVLEIKAEEMNE